MIQKHYRSILDQVYRKLGQEEHNVALAKYSNDYSVENFEVPEELLDKSRVYFVKYEFQADVWVGPYDPFLGIIREMFEAYESCSFDEFMDRCEVYELHKPIFRSYMETGKCFRQEELLYNEVDYERSRMTQEVLDMLQELTSEHPLMVLINRIQLAGRSTYVLLQEFLKAKNTRNIGIVLGMNELYRMQEHKLPVWDALGEDLENQMSVFHMGNAGRQNGEAVKAREQRETLDIDVLWNLVYCIDLEQARYYMEKIERKMKFENMTLGEAKKFEVLHLYAYVSVYMRDLPKALEISEDIRNLKLTGQQRQQPELISYYIKAMAYMYQSKLTEAIEYANRVRTMAIRLGRERAQFEAELLEVQAKMAGWNNIFFCAQNVEVNDEIMEKLIKYNYRNHLAYVYVYAYDNKPEIMARAYYSESQLIYFSKGIKIAKEIGNEQLIYNAYQKNIMLASTNGMHEISLLYTVRTFENMKEKHSMKGGRLFSGIGYNLSALNQNQQAKKYFQKAIKICYELELPEDIAEIHYNMAINCIALGEYDEANDYLLRCMKAIESLHLNSLRVCNLSKLYGLLALVNAKLGNRFSCEQYLGNSKQFLNYVIEKEKLQNEAGVIHDYARCDDDMFLYHFSLAMLEADEGNEAAAFSDFASAETYLVRAEGNQFFCYKLFRMERIRFYANTGRHELKENEELMLKQYETGRKRMFTDSEQKMLEPMDVYLLNENEREVTKQELETQLRQESMKRAYLRERRQIDFISTWQKVIDVSDVSAETMMEEVMRTFEYHFNLDRTLYIQFRGRKAHLLYNDTGVELPQAKLRFLKEIFEHSRKSFVVSKVSNNYSEYLNVIELFGEDNVCSMAAIPFFDNGRVTSIMIAYVLMKDNWHSSVNRYMLDESDLRIYELLFREVVYSLNRLYAYEKVYEMNTALYKSAVTDQLTGILNRKGFYQNIEQIVMKLRSGKENRCYSIMFIDLDNFKTYNDTFGHDIGDLLLQSMANIFERVCRNRGFVTRYGGDEFIILLYTSERKELQEIAEQIYTEIRAQNGFRDMIAKETGEPVKLDEKKLLSCSIGIVSSDEVRTEEDFNEMIKKADDLLYMVKGASKGTYKFMD